jgi:hypothetical protein
VLKYLILMALMFTQSVTLAECYKPESSTYFHAARQRVGGSLVTVGESASGGVQVVVNNTITLNKSPGLVAALYEDVGEVLFSISNYVFKMCDPYYFGGIWANVENSTFLEKRSFVLQRDKSPHDFSLFIDNGSLQNKLFLISVGRAGEGLEATIEWQTGNFSSQKITTRDNKSLISRAKVRVGDFLEFPGIGKIEIQRILDKTTDRPAWVVLGLPE